MLIEATSQSVTTQVYILTGNDDLSVANGITLISQTTDAILANTGQHTITVSGVVMALDDTINTIGCEAAQTVVIEAGSVLLSGFSTTGLQGDDDGDGVILDGIGSTLVNNGFISARGTGISLFVRDAGTTTVTNNGFVTADKFGVWNKFGVGVLNFTNTGTIESPIAAYFGGTATDNLTNSGTFIGDVMLNGGNDVYLGQSGNVIGTIHGGDGNDRFVLGVSVDVVDGGFGFDTLDLSAAGGSLIVDLADSANNRGPSVQGDTLLNIEEVIGGTKADIIRGNAADNALHGRNGSDRLEGGDGQDVLSGGTGGDILTGGAGGDVFLYLSQAEFRDAITDFETGVDFLRFEGQSIGMGLYQGGLDISRFHSGTSNAAEDVYDRFIFNTTDATLWFDKDGSGTKHQAALVADLQDGVVLTAASIDII